VIQALIAAGFESDISPSIGYFRSVQNDDAGWTFQKPSEFGEETDSNSTALVIQALRAAGEDLSSWGDPQQTLLSFQLESGAFSFNSAFADPNILSTIQAIPTLAGVDYAHPFPESVSQPRADGTIVISVLITLILVMVAAYLAARLGGGSR
jgi:hypothetical protein